MRYRELIEGDITDIMNAAEHPGIDDERAKSEYLDMVELIKRDCQPYLSQVDDPISLYRGVSRSYDGINVGRPLYHKKRAHLEDRKTKAMSHFGAQYVQKYFTENFGHPYRNGVMAINDQLHSGYFGVDTVFFPIGEFEFLWSPTIKDLNWDMPQILKVVNRDPKEATRLIKAVLDKGKYQTTDLQAAVDSKNEIMFWVKEYYAVDATKGRRADLVKLLK